MTQPTTTAGRRTAPARPARSNTFGALWSSLVRPALLISFAGACAVFYLVSCARLSVIECDLRRLERTAQDEQAHELGLHRELAELRNAEQIRAHIVDRGLCRPVAIAQVRLTDVPLELAQVLPTRDGGREAAEVRLGQLPSGLSDSLDAPAASTP